MHQIETISMTLWIYWMKRNLRIALIEVQCKAQPLCF